MDLALVSVGWWLGPYGVERISILGLPGGAVVTLVAIGLTAIGLIWLRNLLRSDELTRGEARWRYRERRIVDRLDEALVELRAPCRTPGWWMTRLEFAAAIGAIVFAGVVLAWSASVQQTLFFELESLPAAAGFGGMLFGLGWMIRIYRAPAEGARGATWRFRDHA
jgi:uncharacterized membrane protein YgdD (TMEM256/DUF423 family)